jgi:hypothetical protein
MRTAWRTFLIPLILLGVAMAGASAPHATPAAAAMPAPIVPAQTECPVGSCNVFLPALTVAPIAPVLLQPADQAQVDSIAPTLFWTPAISGTSFLVQVATEPDFAQKTIEISTTKTLKLAIRDTQFTVPRNNLEGSTTYYWRVGVMLPEGMSYSPVSQFTTAVEDPTRLPPPPQLLTPANGERITTPDPTLTWAAPADADAYRVKVLLADGETTFKTSSVIEMPRTNYSPDGFEPKVVYYWQVRVHSSYGWGDYGPTPGWRFRTP